jgi:hypothetical protein
MNLPPGKYYWDKENSINEKDITIHNIKHLQCGTGTYWIRYRLGDTIGGKYNKPFKTIEQYWPGSIKDKYMKLTNNKANNYDVLFNIIKEYPFFKFDTTNLLIIGIRIGDVLGKVTLDTYVKPVTFYKDLDLTGHLNKTVIICCGSHYNSNTPKTTGYVNDLYKIMKEKGFENVFIRGGNSPDDDLTLMCGADNLITGLGGYHKMIRTIVMNHTKNNVIG